MEKQNFDTSSGIDLETKKLKNLVEAISQKLNSEVFGEDQKENNDNIKTAMWYQRIKMANR